MKRYAVHDTAENLHPNAAAQRFVVYDRDCYDAVVGDGFSTQEEAELAAAQLNSSTAPCDPPAYKEVR